MKVQEALSNPSGMTGVHAKEEKRASETKEASFQGQLKKVETRSLEQRINEMVNRIVEQGQKLGKKVDVRELKVYKRLISEFLDEAVGNSFRFSKQSLLDRRGRHKVYANIKKINTELENLTREILHGEKDNLRVLQSIEDIRGLIMDILL